MISQRWSDETLELLPVDERLVDVLPDFEYQFYSPADSVLLVTLEELSHEQDFSKKHFHLPRSLTVACSEAVCCQRCCACIPSEWPQSSGRAAQH